MKIGLISDSHDNIYNMKKSVNIFNTLGVEYVIHAGDIIAPFSLKILDELKCPWKAIFGNNDGEREGLAKLSAGRIEEPPLYLSIGERRFCIVHNLEEISSPGEAEIVVFGHTHKREIFDKEGVLFINPGESGGHLTNLPTIAILDILSLHVDFLDLLSFF